jgi:hypothetical protein
MMEIKMRSQYVKILKERGKLKAFLHIEPGYVKEAWKKGSLSSHRARLR